MTVCVAINVEIHVVGAVIATISIVDSVNIVVILGTLQFKFCFGMFSIANRIAGQERGCRVFRVTLLSHSYAYNQAFNCKLSQRDQQVRAISPSVCMSARCE